MIKNERQYRITRAQVERFERTIRNSGVAVRRIVTCIPLSPRLRRTR